MRLMATNKQVDGYIAKAPPYARPILEKLRSIIRGADRGLDETIEWGAPTFEKNGMVCSFHAFKSPP